MKAFLRFLVLWTVLAGTVWLLLQPSSTRMPGLFIGVGCMFGLPFATALTWFAAAALPERRVLRWPLWTVTVAGWSAVGLFLAGRIAETTLSDDRQVLLFATIAAGVVALPLITRTGAARIWQAMRDTAAAAAVVMVTAGGWYCIYEARTASIATQAKARWAQIGLPMDAFEQTLEAIPENSGSHVAREAFRKILSQRFYKPGTDAAILEPVIRPSEEAWNLVTRACRVISAKLPASDELDATKLPLTSFEPNAATLDETYRQILASEPPVWACDPLDGPRIDVPNFLGMRMFAQLASAESLRRLAEGDEAGAMLPLAACQRVGSHLESNPTLVALMIHVAVDALIAQQQARLAGSDIDFESIGRDAARWRDSLVRSLQWDAWMMLHRANDVAHEYAGHSLFSHNEESWGILRNLPEWTRPITAEVYIHRQCAIGALHNAEHAAICRAPRTRALRDLGARQHERVSSTNPTICDQNVSRATKRIHATLLLREQVNLIRDARARLAAGEPVESRDSAVLPRGRWELSADADGHSVSIRLVNAPKWVYEGDVAGADFWVLPLDGSVPWHFRAQENTIAALR